jgi:amino acid permease
MDGISMMNKRNLQIAGWIGIGAVGIAIYAMIIIASLEIKSYGHDSTLNIICSCLMCFLCFIIPLWKSYKLLMPDPIVVKKTIPLYSSDRYLPRHVPKAPKKPERRTVNYQ